MGDKVDLLPAEEDESFLQVNSITLVAKPGKPKLPKITSLQYLCNISRNTR